MKFSKIKNRIYIHTSDQLRDYFKNYHTLSYKNSTYPHTTNAIYQLSVTGQFEGADGLGGIVLVECHYEVAWILQIQHSIIFKCFLQSGQTHFRYEILPTCETHL
jgi:hypothetical protein